jgi:hypothetical protein
VPAASGAGRASRVRGVPLGVAMPAPKNPPPKHPVVIHLHGQKAPLGVDIDALSDFFVQLRGALRAFDRQERGTRATQGRPDQSDAAASAFRLVRFRTGSGIATIDPFVAAEDHADGLGVASDVDAPKSLVVLDALLARVKAKGHLDRPVVEALAKAQRSMGPEGRFGIRTPSMPRRLTVDGAVVARLRDALEVREAEDQPVTVFGQLHHIETHEPRRAVGVRGQSGVEWVCSYGEELRSKVGEFLDQVVEVRGVGRQTGTRQGRLTVSSIALVPGGVTPALFALEDVPLAELMGRQGVAGAQGTGAFFDESLADDEGQRFLETLWED